MIRRSLSSSSVPFVDGNTIGDTIPSISRTVILKLCRLSMMLLLSCCPYPSSQLTSKFKPGDLVSVDTGCRPESAALHIHALCLFHQARSLASPIAKRDVPQGYGHDHLTKMFFFFFFFF